MASITSLSPQEFITDRSNAVVLLWFFVACFWCQSFGVSFFRERVWLAVCFHCILSFVILVISRFGF